MNLGSSIFPVLKSASQIEALRSGGGEVWAGDWVEGVGGGLANEGEQVGSGWDAISYVDKES